MIMRNILTHKLIGHPYRLFNTAQKLPQKTYHTKKIVIGTVLTGLLGYDGIKNDFAYTGSCERFIRSTSITFSILFDYLINLYGVKDTDDNYEELMKTLNRRSSEKILQGCLKNGGLYIKVGQGVAHINHILPKEFTEPLKQLFNECLTRKPDEVDKLFVEEFGKKPTELFKTFNYDPIAAASLAQVFEAETHDGDKVAVKVQYIDLQKRFKSDVGTILMLSNFVNSIFKAYKFGWILEDLQGNLLHELDFLHEARNSEQCRKDLAKFDFVYIPKVYWDLSNKKVLTCEFIDGYKIGNVDKIRQDKFKLDDIDMKLFKIFSEQIFNTGFVHADPHEGNVFVRKNKRGKAEIVLIDHGLYESISPDIRENLCYFWKAIVLDDHKQMAYYSKKLNVDDCKMFAEILFQRPMNMRGAKFSTKLTEEELAYFSENAKKNFDQVIKTLQQIPRNMLFIVRNLNIVRAIARDHGDPVDRPKVMARFAMSCIQKNSTGINGFFSWITERLYFEYKLWLMSTRYWILRSYLKFLTKVGRSPDTSHLFDGKFDV